MLRRMLASANEPREEGVVTEPETDPSGTCRACAGSADGCQARQAARCGRCCRHCSHQEEETILMPPISNRLPADDPRCGPVRCDDCASQVWEVWSGAPPDLVLAVEIEHSTTCPVWSEPGRELAFTFLPRSATAAAVTHEDDQ